jgi:hypothetical protein
MKLSVWAKQQRMQRTDGRVQPDPGHHLSLDKAWLVINPAWTGEIPVCESSLKLFE